MADLKGLDDATLKQMLENASSYDERSAIRKEIRERKKQTSSGPSTSRGTSTYNRFAGGRKVVDSKSKSFIPGGVSTSSDLTKGSKSPMRVESPSAFTPPVAPLPEPSSTRNEKELESKLHIYEEESRIQKEELARQERQQQEEEMKLREEQEIERRRQEEAKKFEEERKMEEERKRLKEQEEMERRQAELERKEEERRAEEQRQREEEEQRKKQQELEELRREEEEKKKKEEANRREEEWKKQKEEDEARKMKEQLRSEKSKKDDSSSILSTNKDEPDRGASPFGVQLKSRGGANLTASTPTPKKTTEPSPEFRKLKLKKTDSGEKVKKTESTGKQPQGFGVTLKTAPSDTPPRYTGSVSTTRDRSHSYNVTPTPSTRVGGSSVGGAPKTLADFQKLTSRNRSNTSPAPPTASSKASSGGSLQRQLVNYVNECLELRPRLSHTGNDLYDTCKKPSVLCHLINKSVRGTVDLRALTKTPPPSASRLDKEEALEENMTLVVESARAIGCAITSQTAPDLIKGDPATIKSFLIQLIRARVVNMPGMDDVPSSTFEDLGMLMEKLGLGSQDETDVGDIQQDEPVGSTTDVQHRKYNKEEEEIAMMKKNVTWKDNDNETSKEVDTKPSHSSKEQRSTEIDINEPSLSSELSYEERAALRRADREKKRREREKLASAK